MKIYFDKYEKRGAYHWQWYETNKFDYRDLVQFALDCFPTTGSVLDVGCGDGLISFKLFEHGLRVVGIDDNKPGIKLARSMCLKQIYGEPFLERVARRIRAQLGRYESEQAKRFAEGELRFRAQSVYDLPESDSFDYILCHEVIEHVPRPKELLAIMHDRMKHSAIISTPNGLHNTPRRHDYQFWTPEEFEELLEGYNFEFLLVDEAKMYVRLLK